MSGPPHRDGDGRRRRAAARRGPGRAAAVVATAVAVAAAGCGAAQDPTFQPATTAAAGCPQRDLFVDDPAFGDLVCRVGDLQRAIREAGGPTDATWDARLAAAIVLHRTDPDGARSAVEEIITEQEAVLSDR